MLPYTPIAYSGKLYRGCNNTVFESIADTQEHEVHHLAQMQSIDLIGREQEITTICALLQRVDVRLLVITGPGGVGKTHLALRVAATFEKSFPDGICCISFAALKDADLVIPTLVQELGLSATEEEPSAAFQLVRRLDRSLSCQVPKIVSCFTRLEMYLRSRRFLLLLDNFEQVARAAPTLADLLMACPALKILVTSREKLHLRIEHEFVVSPLAVPDSKQMQNVERLIHYAAVSLFVQRATAIQPDFQLTSANAPIVGEICRRLDGLPLAIELAAARMKLLSPQALLARLEQRLQILTSRARDLPRRQQTLRNTLAWSYDLLDKEEQMIFRLLSVVQNCTLEAAETICSTVYRNATNVLESITSLVDKNLLQRVEQIDGNIRLIMLETIREYGQEWLASCGETEMVCQAHASYYMALVERAELELSKVEPTEWLKYLEQEYANLRVVMRWLIEQNKIEAALHLCGILCSFWLISDYRHEGYQWVERVLAESEDAGMPVETRAKALSVAGILANYQNQYQRGTDFLYQIAGYQKPSPFQSSATILPSSELPDGLTPREGEVLHLLARGLTNAQIAEKLVISPNTVHAHSRSIYNKLAVSSRSAATRYAIEHKLS